MTGTERPEMIVTDLRQRKLWAGRYHNELWIAATARIRGAAFLTRNPADFTAIPALEVITTPPSGQSRHSRFDLPASND